MDEKPLRVLLIEDNPGDVRLVQEMLAKAPGEPALLTVSGTLSDGVRQLAKGNIDIVLLDLGLPDSQGLDTFGKVHAHAPAAPVVIITGLADETVDRLAIQKGAQDCIVKSLLTSTALARVLRRAIERKQAEDALKRSSEFARAVLDSTHDAVSIVATRDFRILGVNRAFLQQYGVEEEAVLGKTCYEITHHRATPCSDPDDICPLVAAAASGGHSVAEHVHYAPDGTKMYVEVSATPIVENGEVTRVVHVSRDITERKKIEEELRLRAKLLDTASDSIFVHDLEGNLVYANETACETRGYTRDEMIGLNLSGVVPPKYAALIRQRMRRLVETGEDLLFESAHFRKDGSVMPVEVHSRLIDWRGRQLVLASVRDITERKRAEEDAQRHSRDMAILNDVMVAVSGSLELKEVLDIVLRGAIGMVGAEGGWIRSLDETEHAFRLAAWRGISDGLAGELTDYYRDSSEVGTALRSGKSLLFGDITEDKSLALWKEMAEDGWHSNMAAPVLGKNGVVGSLVVVSPHANKFAARELQLLELLAGQIGTAVEKARLFGEVERHNRELAAINAVMAAVGGPLDLIEVLEIALDRAAEVVGAGGGWVRLLNEAGDGMDIAAHFGLSGEVADLTRTGVAQGGTTELVMRTGRPLVIPDIQADKLLIRRDSLLAAGWRSVISAPLQSSTRSLGIVTFLSREKGRFGPDSERLLETVAREIALAVEKAQLYGEMKNRALTNWLTGLYNRGHFEERLAQELDRAARSERPVAVAMMDVNNFKHFNDAYGHLAGDKVLQAVARAIRAGVRSFDIAARYGGDEFALILPGADQAEARKVVVRIQKVVKESAAGIVPGLSIEISLSAGIACAHPGAPAPNRAAMVEAADKAMYVAKRRGSGIEVASVG